MSPTATRIQRRRTKGWHMPENTVYVGRPHTLGNPWSVFQINDGWAVSWQWNEFGRGKPWYPTGPRYIRYDTRIEAHTEAVRLYREYITTRTELADMVRGLAGKNLCCWCPPNLACHADVLIDLALTTA